MSMYLPLADDIVIVAGLVGEFSAANTVCFNNVRSLHSAEINGKSRCLLRSRKTLISMVGVGLWSSLDTNDILVDSFVAVVITCAVERIDDVTETSIWGA